MTRRVGAASRRDGFVLVVALFALVVLVTAMALVAEALVRRHAEVRREAEAVRLVALLDAAASHALAELRARGSWNGVRDEPLGDGSFDVAIERRAGGERWAVFTARYGGRRRRATARVVWSGDRPVFASWRPLPAGIAADPGAGS